MTTRLDVGCGAKPIDGFTGVDAYVIGEGIINAPMWKLPYEDGAVDEIYCSHALEHAPRAAVIPTLREFNRCLTVGGMLTILVPDLEWCCRAWLEHKSNDWYMEVLFGNQNHPGEFHQTGFTVDIMTSYLIAAGFTGQMRYGETNSHAQKTLVFQLVKEPISVIP